MVLEGDFGWVWEAKMGPENGTRGGSMQVQPEIHEMVPLPHKTSIFWMEGTEKIIENRQELRSKMSINRGWLLDGS